MFQIFTLILALNSLYQPSVIRHRYGDIPKAGNVNFVLPQASKGYYYSVNVRGQNVGGDIDCYLLVQNPKGNGWVIFAKDEEANKNKCSFGFYAEKDTTFRLWLANNGTHNDAYFVGVSQ